MAKGAREDFIVLYIGDRPFTLADLGPAADMRLDEGLQRIIDEGLLGEEFKGRPWYEIVSPSGLKLDSKPDVEETFLYTLHTKWRDVEREITKQFPDGKLTDEARELIARCKREYDLAKKLSKD